MRLSGTLQRFAVPYDIIRPATIERVAGRAVPAGEPRTLQGSGSVQPATAKDLQRLPEGQRSDAVIAIYTEDDLQTGDIPGTLPDRIIPRGAGFTGVEFEIQSEAPWPQHRKYLAIKAGQ